jgi:hypothetical protein
VAEFPAGYDRWRAQAQTAPGGAGDIVSFTRVRVVLRNPDGTVALDTVVNFPAGATELQVTLSVPIPASAPPSGVPMTLNLRYVNAAGDTVFSGGPVTVNVTPTTPGGGPPPPANVTIPVSYTGPGAGASTVRITPRTLTVSAGAAFSFSAQALDAAGSVVPNTPVVFSSDNTAFASINAATGAGIAGFARGTVGISATLLTGPSDAAALTIRAVPSALVLVSGAGQTANVNASLGNPVVVRVTGNDGLGLDGVSVSFAAQNGGAVATPSATTDASGNAQTTWRLGPAPGTQSLIATSAGLTGSPLTVTATARALDPVRLEVATQPAATTAAGVAFGTVVRVVDATGAVVPTFAGPVTVALAAGAPPGALLAGTMTVNAVAGIATFADLRLTVPGTYGLTVSASPLIGAATGTFRIVPAPAAKLAFQNYPIAGATAGVVMDVITVVARDAYNNTATDFAGPVTLSVPGSAGALGSSQSAPAPQTTPPAPSNVVLSEPVIVNAASGIATFSDAQLNVAGSYQLAASSPGLTSALGPGFTVVAGPASVLTLVSGGGQTAASGSALPNPVVIRTADAWGNAVGGRSVSFTPATGHGTANPSSATTNSAGLAQTTWTLAGGAGTKTLNVSGSGLQPNPLVVNATATGAAGPTGPAYGYPNDLGGTSSHSPNYLLGSLISVPTAGTLTHLSVLGKSSGALVKLALYTDVAGSPGTLVAATGTMTLAVGANEFAVTPTPLPAGNYWIMGIYNVHASIGIDFNNSDVVKYIAWPFASAPPTTFPTPTVYTGQRFNYYIRVQ